MKYNKLIPELSVTNIENSRKFYCDILGFKVEYERPENKFLFLSREGSQIMLEEINGNWNLGELKYPFGRGINFQIETNHLYEISQKLNENKIPLYKDIFESQYVAENIIYKELELLIQDPDGYLLRFQQTINEN